MLNFTARTIVVSAAAACLLVGGSAANAEDLPTGPYCYEVSGGSLGINQSARVCPPVR